MRKHNFYHFMLRLFALPASLCLVLMQKLAALSQIVYGLGNRKQWALGWTQKGTKYLQIFWEDCHSSQQHSSKCRAMQYVRSASFMEMSNNGRQCGVGQCCRFVQAKAYDGQTPQQGALLTDMRRCGAKRLIKDLMLSMFVN